MEKFIEGLLFEIIPRLTLLIEKRIELVENHGIILPLSVELAKFDDYFKLTGNNS